MTRLLRNVEFDKVRAALAMNRVMGADEHGNYTREITPKLILEALAILDAAPETVPLTDAQIDEVMHPLTVNVEYSWRKFARALEARWAEAREGADYATLARNAERYEWLRKQNWSLGGFVVTKVANVKLGSYCPALELLDAEVDEALGYKKHS